MNETPAPSLPANVKVVGAASLLTDIATEMIFPLLPQFLIHVLHGTLSGLGMIEGVADSVASILKLFSGSWSDRAGSRKGFVVLGYGIASAARPLIGLVVAPWQLLVIRTTDRIGKGIRAAPRDALIADSTTPDMRGRAFGFHQAMDHLGAAIGPLIAALFLVVWPGQLRTLFLLAIVPGAIVMVLVILGLRDTKPRTTAGASVRLTLAPFGRDFRIFLVALGIFTLGNSSDAFLLVRASELGVGEQLLPLLWCVFHVAKSAGNWLVGGAVDRRGARGFIIGGWIWYAIIYVTFGFATEAWHAWALFIAYALFASLTEPAEKTFIGRLAGAERKGLAYGWYNFAIGIGVLPASVLFGLIYQHWGAVAAFSTGAGLALAASAILIGVRAPASDLQGVQG